MPRVTVIVLTNSRARRHDVRRNDYKYFFLRIKRRPCWLQHLCWRWHLPIHFFSIHDRDFHYSCSVIAILSCLDLAQLWCPDITWWNTFDSRTAKIFSSWGLRGMVQLNFCNWNVFFLDVAHHIGNIADQGVQTNSEDLFATQNAFYCTEWPFHLKREKPTPNGTEWRKFN